ncbi:MAG: phosphoribosyltransferase family protein [Patescibacteria group bacterium]
MKKKTKGHIQKPAIKFRRWRGYQLEINKKGQPIIHVTFNQYLKLILKLIHLLIISHYRPDIIICVATGGLFGAIIARILGIRYGVWMAQGYRRTGKALAEKRSNRTYFAEGIAFIDRRSKRKKEKKHWPWHRVLIIDDLDDSGATLHKAEQLLRDWYGYEFEIRTMVLWHKKCSNFYAEYVGDVIPEEESTGRVPWIDQPHEDLTRQMRAGLKRLKDVLI